MLRVFMADKTGAEVFPQDLPGRWVEEPSWPSASVQETPFFLNAAGLSRQQGPQGLVRIDPVQTVGL